MLVLGPLLFGNMLVFRPLVSYRMTALGSVMMDSRKAFFLFLSLNSLSRCSMKTEDGRSNWLSFCSIILCNQMLAAIDDFVSEVDAIQTDAFYLDAVVSHGKVQGVVGVVDHHEEFIVFVA